MRKLGRKKDHREHMMRNLATSLILYERVTTTTPKAKELKRIIDKLISCAKSNDLSARRALISYVYDENAVKKMFEVIVPRFNTRSSGYTKIYKTSPRKGDLAEMSIIEFIKDEKPAKEDKKPAKPAKATKNKA